MASLLAQAGWNKELITSQDCMREGLSAVLELIPSSPNVTGGEAAISTRAQQAAV